MQNKSIVACGCSLTHGYFLSESAKSGVVFLNTYPELFAESIGATVINLAKPGASNYCIAKQIEYAATLHPDFVVVGLTSSYRVDYYEHPNAQPLKRRPTILDWEYNGTSKTSHTASPGTINSNPLVALERKSHPHARDLVKYVTKHIDPDIMGDKDRYVALGILLKLQQLAIPHVVVDWFGVLEREDTTQTVCDTMGLWKDYVERFGGDGYGHFSKEGHECAASVLAGYISANNLL